MFKLFLFPSLILLWGSLSSSIDSMKVFRTTHQRIRMSSDCSSLKSRIDSLTLWLKQAEKKSCKSPSIDEAGEGICSADITSCVPSHVAKYQGLSSEAAGPNCWNLALVMAGLVPFMRETPESEWSFFLSSPLCRKLSSNEKPMAGDIGSIEVNMGKRTSHIHGFIHVGPDLIYQKSGFNIDAPFTLMTESEMLKSYPLEMTGECQSDCGPQTLTKFLSSNTQNLGLQIFDPEVYCDKNPEELKSTLKSLYGKNKLWSETSAQSWGQDFSEACKKRSNIIENRKNDCSKSCGKPQINYFRCQSLKTFSKKFTKKETESYSKITKSLNGVECSLEKKLLNSIPLNKNQLKNMNDILNGLAQNIVDESKKSNLSENEQILLGTAAVRIRAAQNGMTRLLGANSDDGSAPEENYKLNSMVDEWVNQLQKPNEK